MGKSEQDSILYDTAEYESIWEDRSCLELFFGVMSDDLMADHSYFTYQNEAQEPAELVLPIGKL